MNQEKYRRFVLGQTINHDDDACKALLEYESEARYIESKGNRISPALMNNIAIKYHVTIPQMKEHWQCVERLIGKD